MGTISFDQGGGKDAHAARFAGRYPAFIHISDGKMGDVNVLDILPIEAGAFYLPSYSPEFNPDEMANADIKQAVTTKAPARTKLQLVKTTSRHLCSVQKQPERIRRYFEHDPVRYAA